MTVNKPEILRVLQETYPEAKAELHFSNPYEMLVSTMLSAQCTDKQVNKVTPAVFRDFPNPRAMAATTAEVLYPYIKSCGFKTKAANIVAAVKKAAETGWFSQYTMDAQKRLFDLRPMEYRSASEVKAAPNKMVATYHTGALYTNLDELRGQITKEQRKVVMDGAVSEEQAAEAAQSESAQAQ